MTRAPSHSRPARSREPQTGHDKRAGGEPDDGHVLPLAHGGLEHGDHEHGDHGHFDREHEGHDDRKGGGKKKGGEEEWSSPGVLSAMSAARDPRSSCSSCHDHPGRGAELEGEP